MCHNNNVISYNLKSLVLTACFGFQTKTSRHHSDHLWPASRDKVAKKIQRKHSLRLYAAWKAYGGVERRSQRSKHAQWEPRPRRIPRTKPWSRKGLERRTILDALTFVNWFIYVLQLWKGFIELVRERCTTIWHSHLFKRCLYSTPSSLCYHGTWSCVLKSF